jgi:hypothetical protein
LSAKSALQDPAPPYSIPAHHRFEQPTLEERDRAEKARVTKEYRRNIIAPGS